MLENWNAIMPHRGCQVVEICYAQFGADVNRNPYPNGNPYDSNHTKITQPIRSQYIFTSQSHIGRP